MACGGCAQARSLGTQALAALANGDGAGFEAALSGLQRVAEQDFTAKPVKAATVRAVQAGLARLGAVRR